MMTFSSSADLSRLHIADPALPVINKLANGLFSEPQPTTITLMQPGDINHPLTELFEAEDVSLEGILEQQGMYLIALQTEYDYGLVIVVPDEEWLDCDLRRCIESNLYH